jgi:hypothetical protein
MSLLFFKLLTSTTYLFFVLKTLPDGGKLDGIIRSFLKTSNEYKILYQDGETEDVSEEGLAKMIGVEYAPKPLDGNEDVKMKDATADESVVEEPTKPTVTNVVDALSDSVVQESQPEMTGNEANAEDAVVEVVQEESLEIIDNDAVMET